VRLLRALADQLTANVVSQALSAARISAEPSPRSGGARGSDSSRTRTSAAPRAASGAILESRLAQLSDPFDPIEAWNTFGGANLEDLLSREPPGVLEAMLRHARMPEGPKPRGKSSAALAKNIAQRLDAYLGASPDKYP
jgi:hypothetical protein